MKRIFLLEFNKNIPDSKIYFDFFFLETKNLREDLVLLLVWVVTIGELSILQCTVNNTTTNKLIHKTANKDKFKKKSKSTANGSSSSEKKNETNSRQAMKVTISLELLDFFTGPLWFSYISMDLQLHKHQKKSCTTCKELNNNFIEPEQSYTK